MKHDSPTTLAMIRRGERAIVVGLNAGSQQLRNRLLSMGVVRGSEVMVTGVAPFGDPIDVRVLNSRIALRLSEASHIIVIPKS